jgi:hypothetical protein
MVWKIIFFLAADNLKYGYGEFYFIMVNKVVVDDVNELSLVC